MKNPINRGIGSRSLAAGLTGFYFVANVIMAHSTETSFWAERRRASMERMRGLSPMVTARADTNSQAILSNMPRPSAIQISGGSKPLSTDADLRGPFAIGEKSGDGLEKLVSPFGTINDVYLSPRKDAPFIVQIQDAHGIEEAQRNISSLIALLGQNPGITLVGVEGAWGPFSVDPYRGFPDPAMTRDLADFFLKKGMIAGPEYAGLTMPNAPKFFGVESSDCYNANVQALKTAYKDRDAAKAWVDRLKARAEKLKGSDYSESLKAFDLNFFGYQSEKVKLADYVTYLTGSLIQMKNRPVTPNLQLLREALAQEKTIDFEQVETERRQMVEKLVSKLSPDRLQELMDKSVEYRAGRVGYGEYHTHLKQVCLSNGISMKSYPQMERYIGYVIIADKIDRRRLLDELDTVERTLPQFLAKTSREKELVSITYDLSLLHKLVRHEMSPTDWAHYQSRGDAVRTVPDRLARLTPTTTPSVDPAYHFPLTPFEDFCRLASERNTAFTDNLAQQMAQDKTRFSILVAGGFHTEGLTALLRKKQISYVVITPKITAIPKDNNYMDVLARDPVPLEQRLAGDRIYLADRVRLSNPNSDPARIARAAITVARGAHAATVSPTIKMSRSKPKDPSTLILLLELGKQPFYLIKQRLSTNALMREKILTYFTAKSAVPVLASLTYPLVSGLGLDLGMTFPWTSFISDIVLLEEGGANLARQWMDTISLFAAWSPLTLSIAGTTDAHLKTAVRPTQLLLTEERAARNRAISQHTQEISHVLYLAAGYDLTNVLTTFPSASSVTMVGLFYNKQLDIDAIKREMKNPKLLLITEDYSQSVLTQGYANYWSFNDLRFEPSLIALELVSLGVAPETVTQTDDGKGLRFKRAGPQGDITTDVFFVPATLGPNEHTKQWPPLRFGNTRFDGLYLKAQYPLSDSPSKIVKQVSANLVDKPILVINVNGSNRSAHDVLGDFFVHRLGGPHYSEGDDAYGNSFQVYSADRSPDSANNIFFHLLSPWMGTETAARWGMRLLPLEIMGLGAAGWFAQGWAQPLLNGMLALDPTLMGAILMVAGILAFRSLHLVLHKIWVGKHPGLRPPENRFWSNTARMMLYAFLPFLVASPTLFALAFSVFAYDHFAYDRRQLLNKKTPLAFVAKTLAISMASATAAVVLAPVVVANMSFPMGTFFLISFVAQALDPATVQSFSDSPSAGLTALAIGTVSNFSTYALSMGWATMAVLGFVTSTAFSKNVRNSIKNGFASILPVLGLIQNAPAQSDPPPVPVVQSRQTDLPTQQQLIREAVLNLIIEEPLLRVPEQIRAVEKFNPNMFKGIAQEDIKTAISDLEDQSASIRAAKNFGRLLGEANGPETRITINVLGFNNWPENVKFTAQAVLAGMLGASQPVLIVSEASGPTEILRQFGVTPDQEVLVKTYVNATVYTTINEVERNNNHDIPLSPIVLVQEGSKNFIGENPKFKAQYFESIAASIHKEIQALLAVLRAA